MSTLRHLALLALLAPYPTLLGADAERAPAPPAPGAPVTAAAPANANPPAAAPKAAEPAAAPAAKAKSRLLPSDLAKASGVSVPLSPRFQAIRDRIDALFHDRIDPPPPPDPRFNPFRSPGAPIVPLASVPTTPGGTESPPAPTLSNDLAILQQAVAMIKVRGAVERGGHSQLVINYGPNKDGTYKEGDVLTLIVQDQPVHLRVRQITRYSVMFSLRDAEYTLKF